MKHILANEEPFLLKRGNLEKDVLEELENIPSKTSDLTNDSGFIDKVLYYGTCTTAAATMPKVCTVETFPTTTSNGVTHAKEGTIIAVKFTNSDTNTTAAPELNVNGIGAKGIMYSNAIVTSTAKNTTVAGTAKMLAYYRYDPDLDGGSGAWEYLGKSIDSNSTYSNVSLGQGYATQNNGSESDTITAALSSYALTANGIVSVKFIFDVPGENNPTLNINAKGAKAIYYGDTPIGPGIIKAGDVVTFIYSTYYRLIAINRDFSESTAVGTLNTNNSTAQTVNSSESFSSSINLHKISKTGSYNDLLNKPTIPTIGTLNTNNSTAQTASSSESFSGNISLHKVSKTGSYNDLLSKPDLLDATYSNGTVYFVNSSTPTAAPSNYYTKSEIDSTVQTLNTAVNNRLKYVLLSQAEYDSLTTKDSGTLYLIGGAKYSVSLSLTGTANTQYVTINNVVYQQSEFPIEVNGGDTLNIVCSGSMDSITITMGGNTVATGIAGDTLTVSNVNDNVVITSYNDEPV